VIERFIERGDPHRQRRHRRFAALGAVCRAFLFSLTEYVARWGVELFVQRLPVSLRVYAAPSAPWWAIFAHLRIGLNLRGAQAQTF
jgi:hypothetical protein